jgi:dienelactone hydrolase
MTSEIVNDNIACCTLPPVSHDYEPKGKYIAYGGSDKAYVVGPVDTGKALVIVFDIFGFFPQTIQGADILAQTLQARVVMPDCLNDKPWPIEAFPPQSEEERKNLQKFFADANPEAILPRITSVARQLQKEGAKKIGVLGYCWGAKIAVSAGVKEDWANGVVAIHPAMLTDDDIKNIKVPLGLYPSKEEKVEDFKRFEEILKKNEFASKNSYKRYPTMSHGWAAARSNLKDPDVKAQYEDVYSTAAGFFKNVFEN